MKTVGSLLRGDGYLYKQYLFSALRSLHALLRGWLPNKRWSATEPAQSHFARRLSAALRL
jgi:hypothetical protein